MAGCGCNHPFIKKNPSPPLSGGLARRSLRGSPDGLGEDVSFAEKPMGVIGIGLLVALGLVGAAYAANYAK